VELTTPHHKNKRGETILNKRPKRRNMDLRFGTLNGQSMYRAGSLITVSRELVRYSFDLVRALEARWECSGTESVG
jgi:hypothetical protein